MSGFDIQLPGADAYPSGDQASLGSMVGMYGAMIGMAAGMMMGYMLGSQQNSCPFCGGGYGHAHDEGRYVTVDDADRLMEKYKSMKGQYEGGLSAKLMPGKEDASFGAYNSISAEY